MKKNWQKHFIFNDGKWISLWNTAAMSLFISSLCARALSLLSNYSSLNLMHRHLTTKEQKSCQIFNKESSGIALKLRPHPILVK